MAAFKKGDAVDALSGTSGIVTDIWLSRGKTKINVKTSLKTPPVTFSAHDLKTHVLASPDTVLVKDLHGIIWALEVCDATANGSHFYFMNEGDMLMFHTSKIIQVIPASLARVRAVMGA